MRTVSCDRGHNALTGLLPRIRPLAHYQLAMPSQQRVRRDDGGEVTQRFPSKPVGPTREAPTVVIGEPQAPPRDLPPEGAILFDQIGECVPLATIEPTGNGHEQQ